MVKSNFFLINKYFVLLTMGLLHFPIWAQNQAIQDSLPFDAVIQDIQFHPVSRKILHIDLY